MANASDQIGLEEIKRRVDAAIDRMDLEQVSLLEGQRPSVRRVAGILKSLLDPDVREAIEREGLGQHQQNGAAVLRRWDAVADTQWRQSN
jgi:hypothetical protein